jgi:hypothetical protein
VTSLECGAGEKPCRGAGARLTGAAGAAEP